MNIHIYDATHISMFNICQRVQHYLTTFWCVFSILWLMHLNILILLVIIVRNIYPGCNKFNNNNKIWMLKAIGNFIVYVWFQNNKMFNKTNRACQ